MADSSIPIQPAAPAAPAAAPTLVKVFVQNDEFGNAVVIQNVMLVDSQGREQLLATHNDMIALISAIRELHTTIVEVQGGTYPSVAAGTEV